MADVETSVKLFLKNLQSFCNDVEEGEKSLQDSLNTSSSAVDAEQVIQRSRERLDQDEDKVTTLLRKMNASSSEDVIESASKALEEFESRLTSLEAQLGIRSDLELDEQAVSFGEDDGEKASHTEDLPKEVNNQYSVHPVIPYERSPSSLSASDIGLSSFTLNQISRKEAVDVTAEENQPPVQQTPRFRTPSRTPVRPLRLNGLAMPEERTGIMTPGCKDTDGLFLPTVQPVSPFEYSSAMPQLRASVSLEELNNTIAKLNYRIHSCAHLGIDRAVTFTAEDFQMINIGPHEKKHRLLLVHLNRLKVNCMDGASVYHLPLN